MIPHQLDLNRWMLRILLLAVFLTIGAILLISLWYFPLRKFVLSLPFVGLSAAAILGLMLVFIADPYFVDYQGPIVLAFMLVIIAILIIVRLVHKERDKP